MVSILITHYKTPELLKLCLKSVFNQNIDKEVIILDSEYDWQIKDEIIDKFKTVIYLSFEKNVGYTKLVNEGLKIAQGDYILVLNADIIIPDDVLKNFIDFFSEHKNFGLVGPQQLNLDNTVQQTYFRFYKLTTILYRRTFLKKFWFAKKEIAKFEYKDIDLNDKDYLEVDWLMGSAILFRKETIEKIGLLDSRFFMYFQDIDLCHRFWKEKIPVVYCPKFKFFHYHQRGSIKKGGIIDIFINKLTRIHIIDAIRYFWKYR